MDRIDLHVEVTPIPFKELSDKSLAETSQKIAERVREAREIQAKRLKKHNINTNALMSGRLIREYCELDSNCLNLLKNAVEKLGLSARAYDRILKVSRTIADLDSSLKIESMHIAEAIQYRSLDRQKWAG